MLMMRTTLLIIIFAAAFSGGAWAHMRAAGAYPATVAYNAPIPSPTSSRKIDEYGNIRWSDEKARLDNYAIELRNDPTTVAYIICYGGRRSYAGEAQRSCERARSYLRKTGGIDAARIKTVNGGYREELSVELWTPPAQSVPPMASPTVDPSEVIMIRTKTKKRRRT